MLLHLSVDWKSNSFNTGIRFAIVLFPLERYHDLYHTWTNYGYKVTENASIINWMSCFPADVWYFLCVAIDNQVLPTEYNIYLDGVKNGQALTAGEYFASKPSFVQ